MHKGDTSTVATTHKVVTETEYYVQMPLHKREYHRADKVCGRYAAELPLTH